jgi:Chalcone isomerase-like
MIHRNWKALAAAAVLCAVAGEAAAADVAGIRLDDSVSVGGKTLLLNGAGVRTRAVFKVYAMGLYLTKKETTPDGVLSADGPRRVTLHMLRNLSGEDFGQAFMDGMNNNTPKDERSKFVGQIVKFGEMFANHGDLKQGDVVQIDWVPGRGMQSSVNGKPVGEPVAEQAFYNAILRIWLGDKPADTALKPLLLGGK